MTETGTTSSGKKILIVLGIIALIAIIYWLLRKFVFKPAISTNVNTSATKTSQEIFDQHLAEDFAETTAGKEITVNEAIDLIKKADSETAKDISK